MYKFNKKVAMICGVNAAIIAQFIKDKMDSDEAYFYADKKWCRCSILMMTGHFPFFTRHMVADAINKLVDFNVIKRSCHNQNRFDHTNWYTFTEYGDLLMANSVEENKKRPNLTQERPNVVLDIMRQPSDKCQSCDYYDEDKKVCSVCVKEILGEVKERYSP